MKMAAEGNHTLLLFCYLEIFAVQLSFQKLFPIIAYLVNFFSIAISDKPNEFN